MSERLITGLMLVVAVIHFLPIMGVIGVERLTTLYDVEIRGPDMEILMRHRAVMFGMLGAFLGYAAFQPALQPLGFVAAFISLLAFFWLAFSVGGYNGAIERLVLVDGVAAICLILAIVLFFMKAPT